MTEQQHITSIEMDKSHYLIQLGFPSEMTTRTKENIATNHIFAIDCSGSMHYELGKIRQQLKNKLSMLVKENDTVSIIWFSGRGQCGTIVEGLEVKTTAGLQQLQNAVDRYLQTVGLTGFVEPLQTAQDVVERVTKSKNITTHSLLFLTDGYDNCSNVEQIINATKPLGKSLSSVVFVEYGYYCNRNLLTKMAENCGGKLIFSEDFDDFEPSFEEFVTKIQNGVNKKTITLPSKAKFDVAFTNDDQNGVMTYAVDENNSILIESDIDEVFYHAEEPVLLSYDTNLYGGFIIKSVDALQHTIIALPNLYASLYVLSQRMKSNEVYSTLGFIEDVDFIDSFSNAFGKQNLYAFQRKALQVAQGESLPYANGQKNNYVPAADAYCLLNLFDDLMAEEGNLFLSSHPEFQYKSIGAKKVGAISKLEENAEAELNNLLGQYGNYSPMDKAGRADLLTQIGDAAQKWQAASSAGEATFEQSPSLGTGMSDFVWNENRPNLSIRVRQTGKVVLPKNNFGLTEIPSFRYRNYTLIKDGIVNVKKLPVNLGENTFNKLRSKGLVSSDALYSKDDVFILDLTKVPIVNRQMVLDVSAKELAELQFKLTSAKAAQSVFNFFQKENFPKTSEAFAKEYSEEAAAWLKEQGVTDYNGFAPRTTEEKIGESYMSTELNVELEGMKSMPAAKATWDKYQAGKALTNREEIMREGLRDYSDFINSSFYTGAGEVAKTTMLKSWLLDKQKQVVGKVREFQNEIAQIKFAVILGQVWFREFKSLDENRIEIEVNGKPISCTILLENKEVEI